MSQVDKVSSVGIGWRLELECNGVINKIALFASLPARLGSKLSSKAGQTSLVK